ncbi:IS66 family transposase [Thomasclavelia cocleata]|uniref:IS66 family transposase n=1 Tax=Thomasclavelia cocleata TaxID=69824 RepID=UPI000B85F319|nr:transposase [Thomasclavelia cocleata]NDO40908.1 transposase [Thomasclavelia cocleata]PJN80051.1 hypothetical protein CWE04_10460 [Thomasclavelia cocleata]
MAYCWAYLRRRFRDVLPDDIQDISNTLAKTAVDKISRLFAIEKETDLIFAEEKIKIRKEKSKLILDDFFL